jgi:methylmalonyl-CoA mutase cobalamin-binding domain/chain
MKMESRILENLKKSVQEYDQKGAADWAVKAVEAGINPVTALETLTEAIREIGEGFAKGDLFLPDLIGAAYAMEKATEILQEALKKSGGKREPLAKVVIGTVAGDIHSIGSTMVASLMAAEGFEVHNLGVDVKAEKFVETVKKLDAKILAMSALMTMTAPEQKKVIDMLKNQGIRDKVKIMVGGGAITAAFAESIGADGYEATAPGAAKLARKLMGV